MSPYFEIISIEGNIGSGKSTLLANLKKYYENKMDLHDLKLEYILNHYPNRNENIYKMAG